VWGCHLVNASSRDLNTFKSRAGTNYFSTWKKLFSHPPL